MIIRKMIFRRIMCCTNHALGNINRGDYTHVRHATTVKRKKVKTDGNLEEKENLQSKIKMKEIPESDPKKSDVLTFLDSRPEFDEIKSKIPPNLLKKYKEPTSLYLVSPTTAKLISQMIKGVADDRRPVVEVNPGLGLLSTQLLENKLETLYLYEAASAYAPTLKKIEEKYPEKVKYKAGDFFSMGKLAFQDRLDSGSRVNTLLGGLFDSERNVCKDIKIIGAMPTLNFIYHLITSFLLHNSSFVLGTPDMYILMPADKYITSLSENSIHTSKTTSSKVLFQILFEHKVLGKVPRIDFLPWQQAAAKKKVKEPDNMYIVHMKQKSSLPCPVENLPVLWYFFKHRTRTLRIIPFLEQWIPGCGVWLITGQDPSDSLSNRLPGPDDEPLPHMTIFTTFGDLNVAQKLTLFKRFTAWPEFEHCTYRETMEGHIKSFSSDLDMKEDLDTPGDDEHLQERDL